MTIAMNGSWTIRVERAADASSHRFLVGGADMGSGVHAGVPGHGVYVEGSQWTLQMQRRIGHQAWHACGHRLGAATLADGVIAFSIEAEQGTGTLVLSCRRPLHTPSPVPMPRPAHALAPSAEQHPGAAAAPSSTAGAESHATARAIDPAPSAGFAWPAA
jgi:hypothetical protein